MENPDDSDAVYHPGRLSVPTEDLLSSTATIPASQQSEWGEEEGYNTIDETGADPVFEVPNRSRFGVRCISNQVPLLQVENSLPMRATRPVWFNPALHSRTSTASDYSNRLIRVNCWKCYERGQIATECGMELNLQTMEVLDDWNKHNTRE